MPAHDPFSADPPMPTLPPPEPLEGRRPRILAHVLRAMPAHNAGGERMLHAVLEGFVARGWDAAFVAVEHRGEPYVRNGIVVQSLADVQMRDPYTWCDVAVTHLDVTQHALAWARQGRPLLHLVHNHTQLTHHRVPDNGRNAAVWNSLWLPGSSVGGWKGPQVVCRPPSFPDEHRTTVPNRHRLRTATLVNLLGEKGGPLFWRLARRLPDWQFLGVEGAYGFQTVPEPMPDNGTVEPHGVDMRGVWARTTVYLAPSWYESWGLAPVEALASAIPVVAHPTAGLVEALTSPEHGPCAIFADRDDDQAWADALTALSWAKEWRRWSKLAALRSAELAAQTVTDLDRLERFAYGLAAANQGAPVS